MVLLRRDERAGRGNHQVGLFRLTADHTRRDAVLCAPREAPLAGAQSVPAEHREGLEIEIGNPVDDVEEQEGSGEEDTGVGVQAGDVDADPALPPHPRLAVLDAAKEPLALLPLQARRAGLVILILLHLRGPVHDVVDVDGGEGWHHLSSGRWLRGGEGGRLEGRKRQPNKFGPPSPTKWQQSGSVQWRGMADQPQTLHLGVNHHICSLGKLAAPCMTLSVLPGTPGHSPTQQRSECTDSSSVPITASAETRPVPSVLASSLIPLSSAVSEDTAHSPDVSAGCCQLLERSWGKALPAPLGPS